MMLIKSQTLGTASASISFTSIPITYNNLKLIICARGDTAAIATTVALTVNGDSSTKYSYTSLKGDSSAGTASSRATAATSDVSINIPASTAAALDFGTIEIFFPSYLSTSSKPFFDINTTENNSVSAGSAFITTTAHLYTGSLGINSITLVPSAGNFVANSTFRLYGISNS